MRWLAEYAQQSEQQEPQPGEEEAEVITGGGKDGVDVAGGMRQVVAVHAVLSLEMSADGLDHRPASHLALDLRCHAPLLACGVDPKLLIGRCVVAAIAVQACCRSAPPWWG
jgi:hypothetical protein